MTVNAHGFIFCESLQMSNFTWKVIAQMKIDIYLLV